MSKKNKKQETYYLIPPDAIGILGNVCSVDGGVSYAGTEILDEGSANAGHGKRVRYENERTVDHVEIHDAMGTLRSRVQAALRRTAQASVLGPIWTPDSLQAFQAALSGLQAEAARLNERAARERSERRITIAPVFIELRHAVDQVALARRIQADVRATLDRFEEHLRAGDAAKAQTLLATHGKNLGQLVGGMARFSIEEAIACVRASVAEIKKAKRQNREPNLDLSAIESARGFCFDDAGLASEVAA